MSYFSIVSNFKSRIFRGKIRTSFGKTNLQPRIIGGVSAKNLEATLLVADLSTYFDSIDRGKMKQTLLVYGLPKETDTTISML